MYWVSILTHIYKYFGGFFVNHSRIFENELLTFNEKDPEREEVQHGPGLHPSKLQTKHFKLLINCFFDRIILVERRRAKQVQQVIT